MAINREAFRLSKELELVVDGHIATSTRKLTAAWVRSWKIVEAEWRTVTVQLAQEVARDGVPSRRTLRRARNIQNALNTTRAMLNELVNLTGGTLVGASRDLVLETARMQARLIAAQLPKGSAVRAQVMRQADVPNRQLDAIVRRTTQQIASDLLPLTGDAIDAVMDQLIVGAARGQNPRIVARQMLEQVQGAFNGGLARALNISRTELMDGHRAAAMVAQNRHSDVLEGWQWLAARSRRTCPACWSRHGTKYALDVPGPDGHQQCRCARAPVTRSWASLGIKAPEPVSVIRDGRTEFNRLPKAQQLEIMGPTRLKGLKSGLIDWDELAEVRHNHGWRDAVYARPVGDFASRIPRTA